MGIGQNNQNVKSLVPRWLSNNVAIILFGIVVSASMIVLDSRHVTADELKVSQSAIMVELIKISNKMDLNRIRDRIRDFNSQLEELQLYIDVAPGSNLTNARKQNIRRLENNKEEVNRELEILLSHKAA